MYIYLYTYMYTFLFTFVVEVYVTQLFEMCSNVTESDILALERRLLQTMDMIVSKKKR